MKSHKSGEATTLALVGLLIGAAMLYINTGAEAQRRADLSGRDVHQFEVIQEQPGTSAATLLLPAAAGWGVGYMLDEISGKSSSSSRDTHINVESDGDVDINVGDQDNDVTNEDNDESDTDSSYNENNQ